MTAKPTYEELERRVRDLERRIAGGAFETPASGAPDAPDHPIPGDDPEDAGWALADLIDVESIQSLMDEFFSLTRIGIGITDLSGRVLVATGWQDICTRFHRVHPETAKNCLESDLELSNGVEPGTFQLYRCKNNMWDMATPIRVGGRKIGNLYMGQFLFEDEAPDLSTFRMQARKYGFDEQAYIAALQCVPRWSRRTVNTVMSFYTRLAGLFSELGYKNLMLAQTVEAKNGLLRTLSRAETKYRELVENLNEVLFSVDSEGIITYMSPPIESVLGYISADLVGLHYLLMVHPDDQDMIRRSFSEVLHGRIHPEEYRIRSQQGGYRWVRTSSRPILENGRVVGLQGVLSDIHERKQAEEALRASEEKFSKAFRNAPNLMAISDIEDGRLLEVNDAFVRITGHTRENALGRTFVELGLISEKIRKRLGVALRSEGRLRDVELELTRSDGAKRICLYSGERIHVENRSRLLSIANDISERRQIENRLRQAQRMESIGDLAGGIAHDFNNILFPIVGMAELLLEDLPPGSLERENAGEILKAGKRGGELVKQILAFSRQTEHETVPLRIQHLLKEVLKWSRSIIPSDIELIQDIQSDCGRVLADPTCLHQVVMNLIINAYHAVEQTRGSISVRLRETMPGEGDRPAAGSGAGGYAVLSVSDTGCGIDSAVMGKIFDPYFTTKPRGKGTGLGLAVVYGIVREHRGEIRVRSEPGKGTTFDVFLPLLEKTPESVMKEAVGKDPTGDERILVVDDEASIVRLETQILTRLGYHVTSRTGSLDALNAFRENPEGFDLVITDMAMPNLTGEHLAKALISLNPRIPVILCTGFSERLDPAKAEEWGIRGFLMKPIVRSDMARMIRKVLDEAKGRLKRDHLSSPE